MAHIAAANDAGPRADSALSQEARGQYSNLILLCPSCHTTIDKAPEIYTDALVLTWKSEHVSRLANAFGAVPYRSRADVRRVIEPLLASNRAIFDLHGPHLAYRHNPESPEAGVWQHKIVTAVLPTNRRILAVADSNRPHLTLAERRTLEIFRQHVVDLEARHLSDEPARVALQFPSKMADLFLDTQ